MSILGPSPIVAAEDRYHPHEDQPDHSAAEAAVYRFWRHHPGQVPAPLAGQLKSWPDGTHPTVVAYARVDHGRWLVDCPQPGCHYALYASRVDRRFFCTGCGNGEAGQWVPVVWPSDVDVAAIETMLAARPDQTTRNWRPGEPVANLDVENRAHGVTG